ncbi:FtsX-like permease family protein [Pseudactinotalea terrae]|uniref:FtsX-like permease family protein n=1 Tax=Pseudactinotalea terrae TaxID=1743262 RepID=UPI0013907C74|nr:FtsX-like permease family protein [Pseudactinotalea terrae]
MGIWAARWRVALRIAWRDAALHKGRTALVVAMVALPLLAGTTLITVLQSAYPTLATTAQIELGDSAQARVQATGCGAGMVQSVDGQQSSCLGEAAEPPDPQAVLDEAFGPDLVVARELVGTVSNGDAARPWDVRELDVTDLPGIVTPIEGRLPSAPGEGLIGEFWVEGFGGIGDSIDITVGEQTTSVEIVGITGDIEGFSLAVQEPDSQYLYVAPGTLPGNGTASRLWYVTGDHAVTWDDVLELNEAGLLVTSRAVLLDPPASSAVPFDAVNEDDLRMTAYIAGIAALLLIEVVLLIGPAFAVGARRQARQLAQVAAHGGAPRDLRRIVLSSGLVTATTGGVIGLGLGLTAGAAIFGVLAWRGTPLPNLVLPTWELAALLLLALGIGLAAAWIPARTAARADVVATLGGRRHEAAPRKGVPRLGVAVAVLGALTAVLGAVIVRPVVLLGGVVLLEVGIILSAGGAIALVAGLAPRLGVAGRFAVREAARHRTRTGPAVAAVIAAVAVASTLMMYVAGSERAQQDAWQPLVPQPSVVVQLSEGLDPAAGAALVASVADELGDDVPFDAIHPVVAVATGDPSAADLTNVEMEIAPEKTCPWDQLTDAERRTDPSCSIVLHRGPFGTIVDDGTLMTELGIADDRAAQGLASGGVLVPDDMFVWSDGQAHLRVDVHDSTSSAEPEIRTVTAEASVEDWADRLGSLMVSPEVADAIGLGSVTAGALVVSAEPLDDAAVDRVQGAFSAVDENVQVLRDDPPSPANGAPMLISLAIASLVALVATGLATGLAGSHIAPDLATLLAIGAAPRTRRRIVAAQAVVIAGTGGLLGGIAGLCLGGVVVLWERAQGAWPDFPFVVPWQMAALVVAIPLVAGGAGYLFTRSRLPLVRRLAE